ncbi:MAG: YraN family protein [Flavobacteriales bacterium]|nr:YraN family protein [Flavobacteriales bacterium]
MKKAHKLGQKSEEIAAQFLAHKKHQILDRNWRCRKAEIDLISKHEHTLVFSEVKTRSSERFGQPKEFVSERKESLMKDAAEAYLELKNLDLEVRFDILSIVIKNEGIKIEHLENAF